MTTKKAKTEEGTLIEVNHLLAPNGEVMVTLRIGEDAWVFPRDAALRLAEGLEQEARKGEGLSKTLYQRAGIG